MANYWDTVNMIVETSTPEETDWLLQVFEEEQIPAQDRLLLPAERRLDRDPAELYFSHLHAQDAAEMWTQDQGVWLWSEDDGISIVDIVLVLMVFQLKFGKHEPIVVTWASHCDSPRLYSTSGGAAAIFRGVVSWFTPQQAAIDRVKQLGGTPLEDE